MKRQIKILENIVKIQAFLSFISYLIWTFCLVILAFLLVFAFIFQAIEGNYPGYVLKIRETFGPEYSHAYLVFMIVVIFSSIIPAKYAMEFFTNLQSMFQAFRLRFDAYEVKAFDYLERATRAILICVAYSYSFAIIYFIFFLFQGEPPAALEPAKQTVNHLALAPDVGDYLLPSLSGFSGLTLYVVMSYACYLWKEKLKIDQELLEVKDEATLTI